MNINTEDEFCNNDMIAEENPGSFTTDLKNKVKSNFISHKD